MGGGTVKYTYSEFTTNGGGLISFPTTMRILNAWIGNGASDAKVLFVVPRSTYDCAMCYMDSSTTTPSLGKLAGNTKYTVAYSYVLNED